MFPAARRQEVVGVHGLGVSSFFFCCFSELVGCCRTGCVTGGRKLSFLQQPDLLDEIGNLGSCCSSSSKKLVW